jgi:hypothetical protein
MRRPTVLDATLRYLRSLAISNTGSARQTDHDKVAFYNPFPAHHVEPRGEAVSPVISHP